MLSITINLDTSEMEEAIALKVYNKMLESNVLNHSSSNDKVNLLTLREAMSVLRVSRGTFYKLIKEGKIQTQLLGRRRLISTLSIQKLLHPDKMLTR